MSTRADIFPHLLSSREGGEGRVRGTGEKNRIREDFGEERIARIRGELNNWERRR